MQKTIGIVIPTYQAEKHLPHCLTPLIHSPLKPRILVIDSSSTDKTVEVSRSMGVETIVIPTADFNHGSTREMGRNYLQTEIVVMMTQDAYAISPAMLEYLVHPIISRQASLSYARQIPHKGANFFGRFLREFNYPEESHVRSLSDSAIYGAYTFFCSNSCAAYLNKALDEVGGFPFTLFGEDAIVTAKLLHKQHRIAYVAEAVVYHSHNYSIGQEFRRHFDMGVARRDYRELFFIRSDRQRGLNYVKTLLKKLWDESPSQIPYACLHVGAKYFGYRLGQAIQKAPVRIKRIFSGQKQYWKQVLIHKNASTVK